MDTRVKKWSLVLCLTSCVAVSGQPWGKASSQEVVARVDHCTSAQSPAGVVAREVIAFNHHDSATFASTFAPDARVYEYPDKLILRGRDAILRKYGAALRDPRLTVQILKRMVTGVHVVDEERIVMGELKTVTRQGIVIYTIEAGCISRMDLMH